MAQVPFSQVKADVARDYSAHNIVDRGISPVSKVDKSVIPNIPYEVYFT